MKQISRVAAIHDLSGFGRVSLTTVIPILSTMGIQVCPLPTAILSTHTGGFEGFSFVDLTFSMTDFINHWKSLSLEFDAIYSGFLGNVAQIDIVSDFIDSFKKEDTLVVVDPVLADNGELYSTMDEKIVCSMKKLIKKANIITPNFTEAAFLLDEDYKKDLSIDEIKDWMKRLAAMGPDIVVITSVPELDAKNRTGVVAYNKLENDFWKVSCTYIPAHYPGTGDAFTSVLVGSMLNGDSLPIALDRGVQFITSCIRASYGFNYPEREGVLLERMLDNLKLPVIGSSYEMI